MNHQRIAAIRIRAAEKHGGEMDVLFAIAATVEECKAEGAR